jgi:hypothetical protein
MIDEDNFLSINEKDDEDEIEINDFLKCPICMNYINNPRMCLKCKKAMCFQCLKKFYNCGGKQCPLCKTYHKFEDYLPFANLNYIQNFFLKHENEKKIKKSLCSSLVNKSNLKIKDKDINMSYKPELSINNFNQIDNSEICPLHHYKYIYYCFSCEKKLCGICITDSKSKDKIKYSIHLGHNVFKIKDIEKYNIKELFQSYNKISNKKKLVCENIEKFSQNMNYLIPLGNVLKQQISLLSEKTKFNSCQLIQKIENIKNKILLKENENNNELPNIGNNLKEIIRNKNELEYKELINKINNYKKKIKEQKIDDEEFKIEKPEIISYEVYKSEKIILYKLKENKNTILENNSVNINNHQIFYLIEKYDDNNIRYEIRFEINNVLKKKFLVDILVNLPNHNYYNISLYNKYEQSELFLFERIFSIDKFYNLINEKGNIEINIILSEFKF